MTVIASKKKSARGNTVLGLCLVMVLSLVFSPSCGEKQREAITEEEFAEIYGDMLYIGELYRAHPYEMRVAVDSLMKARNIDTLMVNEAISKFTDRTYDIAQLYAGIIERLETAAREDSARHAVALESESRSDSLAAADSGRSILNSTDNSSSR